MSIFPCHLWQDYLLYKSCFLGPLAQSVEHLPFKEGVVGSNPTRLANSYTLIPLN